MSKRLGPEVIATLALQAGDCIIVSHRECTVRDGQTSCQTRRNVHAFAHRRGWVITTMHLPDGRLGIARFI